MKYLFLLVLFISTSVFAETIKCDDLRALVNLEKSIISDHPDASEINFLVILDTGKKKENNYENRCFAIILFKSEDKVYKVTYTYYILSTSF